MQCVQTMKSASSFLVVSFEKEVVAFFIWREELKDLIKMREIVQAQREQFTLVLFVLLALIVYALSSACCQLRNAKIFLLAI